MHSSISILKAPLLVRVIHFHFHVFLICNLALFILASSIHPHLDSRKSWLLEISSPVENRRENHAALIRSEQSEREKRREKRRAPLREREREREREKDQNRLDRRAWRASIIDARVLTSINESAKRSAEPEHAVERISKLPGELTVLNIYIFLLRMVPPSADVFSFSSTPPRETT